MSHEQSGSPEKKHVGSEQSLPDFMSQNFERDPDWFVEPEDTPEYGPPGMPTPLQPMDVRIAERQRIISDSLRRLLSRDTLPDAIDDDLIDMLHMNFDSYNTILGVNNNNSYTIWKSKTDGKGLSPDLQVIEDKTVLGVASQAEMLELITEATGLQSIELYKLYHPFKYRMRHLGNRRQELTKALEGRGGNVTADAEYYDLKLAPYSFADMRELSPDERQKLTLLQASIDKKWKILGEHTLLSEHLDETRHSQLTPDLHQAITEQIKAEEAEFRQIHEDAEVTVTRGLMASIKRHVGFIPEDNGRRINVTERQLFAVDLCGIEESVKQNLPYVHGRSKPDKNSLPVYEVVYDLFKANSDLIIPVSTTAYCYETSKQQEADSTVTSQLAQVALAATEKQL